MPLDLPKCEICEQNDVQITCTKCEMNLCKTCDEKHHSKGKLKEHQRDIYSGLTSSRFCTIKGHEKQLLPLFCQNCSKLICGICVVGDHKGHTYVLAEVAAENAKGILKDAIVPLQETITKAETEIKTTQDEIKVLQNEIKKKEEKIKVTKKRIDENLQKIEEIKSVLNKKVDSFVLLSMVSNLNLTPPSSGGGDRDGLLAQIHAPKSPPPSDHLFEPIATWLNKPVKNWKLLYKWTKDEKTPEEWHKRCDGKGSTVTIIWATGGYIFGGYAHLPWDSSGEWKESKESFLFSLTDGKNRKPYQCLPFQKFQYTLCSDSTSIYWGSGFDLALRIPPKYTHSYSNMGNTYKVPDGFDGQTFLAGSYNYWTIEEI